MSENTQEQNNNSREWLKPWQFKPGQSGNPGGRTKGTISLKEYAKRYLAEMTDEEKLEFMKGIDKVDIWKLAEGNPKQDNETKLSGEVSVNIVKYNDNPAA